MNTLTPASTSMQKVFSQQPFIEYIHSHLEELKHTMRTNNLMLNTVAKCQSASSVNQQEYYSIHNLQIDWWGERLKNREKRIRHLVGKLPYSLQLWDILSKIELHDNPYWVAKDKLHLLHSNKIRQTLTHRVAEAADTWAFMGGDSGEFAPNHMKFVIHLYGYPRGMPKAVQSIFEQYSLLKQIGLICGMSMYYSDRYKLEEQFFHHRYSLYGGLDGYKDPIDAPEVIEQFMKLFEQDSMLKETFALKHAHKNLRDDYVLDAFSECFAAYFMGCFLLPDAKEPMKLSTDMWNWFKSYVYAFVTKPL